MPGRGKTGFGKYISRNFNRPDIGRVKVKVNVHTQQVEDVILETKIDVKEPIEDSGFSVDALIEDRKKSVKKKQKKKSVNKQKNTN